MGLAELGLLLLEVVVGAAEEGGHVPELAVEIFPILPVPDLDMHEQPLGYQMKLMANSFDEHAVMANSLIHVIESAINRFEASVVPIQSLFDRIEATVNPFESLVDLLESAIQATYEPVKSFIKILNQFLIHAASADG